MAYALERWSALVFDSEQVFGLIIEFLEPRMIEDRSLSSELLAKLNWEVKTNLPDRSALDLCFGFVDSVILRRDFGNEDLEFIIIARGIVSK